MNRTRAMLAVVPVTLEVPDGMAADVAAVLDGEYEAGYDGDSLTIVDLGANVGAFTLWANLRWPNSTIHAYEPNPHTHRLLRANVGHLRNVTCHEQAIYPEGPSQQMLYGQYAGDGESGLAAYIGRTFADIPDEGMVPVKVVHPRELPACDVLKVDVEGGEAAILEAMDLSRVSLVLLEYQNMTNRRAIERKLADDFYCVFADSFNWDPILATAGYRPELAGDCYGDMFFINRRSSRLRRASGHRRQRDASWPTDATRLSLRRAVAILRQAAGRAVAARIGIGGRAADPRDAP